MGLDFPLIGNEERGSIIANVVTKVLGHLAGCLCALTFMTLVIH